MTTIEMRVEFPCGLKFFRRVRIGWFSEYSGAEINIRECPIHGKNCKVQGDKGDKKC